MKCSGIEPKASHQSPMGEQSTARFISPGRSEVDAKELAALDQLRVAGVVVGLDVAEYLPSPRMSDTE